MSYSRSPSGSRRFETSPLEIAQAGQMSDRVVGILTTHPLYAFVPIRRTYLAHFCALGTWTTSLSLSLALDTGGK